MFPSPYGVSFILIFKQNLQALLEKVGFRLLTEYHSFLFIDKFNGYTLISELQFPSPYGVSFILILLYKYLEQQLHSVSVSLRSIIHSYKAFLLVSSYIPIFSFRLLTEYHSFLLTYTLTFLKQKISLFVSVSLRSIIHSYKKKI